MVISPRSFDWRPAASSIPQGSILGLFLFDIFINDLGDGAESIPSASLLITKLGGVPDIPEGCAGSSKRYVYRLSNLASQRIWKS